MSSEAASLRLLIGAANDRTAFGVDHEHEESDDKFMPIDLFSRLFRYRPTHGRVPWRALRVGLRNR